MRFSILHLSDLHRDLTDEIPNTWLIDSIANDLDRLEKDQVYRPQLCIVSGDLIYGIQRGSSEPDSELKRQYAQSLEFLTELVERFFGGDPERLVILPGNHDVAYNHFESSCAHVPPPEGAAERSDLIREYFSANSRLRWSWKELSFYRIVDEETYLKRFSYFCDLYEQFYKGQRKYSLEPDNQYDLFDFPDLKLSIMALNSCYNNDPWRRAGQINPSALANACRKIRSTSRSGWLLAAAWHHNLIGGPSQDDYLDPAFLQLLIDNEISLGLHGHQHRSEWFDERYRLGPKARKMTIVSAASLCAGPGHLSPGAPRGYNVLDIDNETWKGRLHQRQMVNSQFNMPTWGPGQFVDTGTSFVDFELCPPSDKRPVRLDKELSLEAADKHLGRGELDEALKLLRPLWQDPMARRMGLKALEDLNNPARTIEMIDQPSDITEAVILGGALLDAGNTQSRSRFLSSPFIQSCTDASVRAIVEKLKLRISR